MSASRRYAVLLVVVALTAVVLSLAFAVPYIFTVTGFAGWAFIGHVVTADDDAPWGAIRMERPPSLGESWP